MKLVIISDTHSRHHLLDTLPHGDVLIFCGDAQRSGTSAAELREFNSWLGDQPIKRKIVIGGNHDMTLENVGPDAAQEIYYHATYLQDSGCEIDGVRFWGSPWQPRFFDWAFNLDRGAPLREKWNLIPDNVDVLITHGPPKGIFDRCPAVPRTWADGKIKNVNVGCADLMDAVKRVKPKVHCFGHIHEGGGMVQKIDGTIFVNASVVNCRMQVANPPMVVEI